MTKASTASSNCATRSAAAGPCWTPSAPRFSQGRALRRWTPPRLLARLEGVTRVVVVGLEARWLDALMAVLPASVKVGLVKHSEFSPDWERVTANLGGRVELLELADFQSWAGQRSALLSFVYGAGDGAGLFALSAWVRVCGPDVRTQFRELIGWDVLQVPLSIYPRWLVAVPPGDFTQLEFGA